MLKAAIFDLDGTLIDSRQDLVDSVNALLEEVGERPLPGELVASFVGEGAARLVGRSLAAARPGLEARLEFLLPKWFEHYGRRLLVNTVAYEGIEALLDGPPAARAVLTNKPGRFARQILLGLGLLDKFRVVVGGDEAPRKPDPEGLLRLCGQLGARPEEAILIGDSRIDDQTGIAAGVPVCLVAWGIGDPTELAVARPAHRAQTPAELLALLVRLAAT